MPERIIATLASDAGPRGLYSTGAPPATPMRRPPRHFLLRNSRARLWLLRCVVVLLALGLTDAVALLVLARTSADPLYREPWSTAQWNIRARNDLLLDGPARYPYPRPEDRWVIGVFGGSVARDLVTSEAPRALATPRWNALAESRGRPLRLQSFAVSGTGYPAQYHLLRLFPGGVHEAVFLDGFNDLFIKGARCEAVTRRAERGLPPRDELLRPLRQNARAMHALAEGPWGELLWETALGRTIYGRRARQASRIMESFFQGEFPGAPPPTGRASPVSERVARWTRCVEEAHRFAAARGLRAHFFLQPNQHVRGTKPFSAQERACCVTPPPQSDELSTYGALTEAYAAMEAEVLGLRARGVSAWSLAHVYERTAETVYTDSCCHLNARGNAILGEAIAATLRGDPGPAVR